MEKWRNDPRLELRKEESITEMIIMIDRKERQ